MLLVDLKVFPVPGTELQTVELLWSRAYFVF